MPKQVAEKCLWGPHCPICMNEEHDDWYRGRQREQPRMCQQNAQHPQALSTPQHRALGNPSHKTFSTPSHLMSLTDTPNKFDSGENGKKRLNGSTKNILSTINPVWNQTLSWRWSTDMSINMRFSYEHFFY